MAFSPYPEPKKPREPTRDEILYAERQESRERLARIKENERREWERRRERGEMPAYMLGSLSDEERAEYEAGLRRHDEQQRRREYVSSPKHERQLDEMARTLKQIQRNDYLNRVRFKLMYSKDIDDVFSDEIAPAKAAAHDAATAIRELRRHIADTNDDGHLSEAGKAERIDTARNVASTKLDATFETARAGIEKINSAIADILKPEENDLEAEIKEDRAWRRYERLLDAGHEPLSVIEQASNDPVALRALRADLPAYMTAKGDKDFVGAVMAEVDRAEKPHLSETKKRALDIKAEVANGAYRLDVAENTARGEIESGETAYGLTTWPSDDHGDVIPLEDNQ